MLFVGRAVRVLRGSADAAASASSSAAGTRLRARMDLSGFDIAGSIGTGPARTIGQRLGADESAHTGSSNSAASVLRRTMTQFVAELHELGQSASELPIASLERLVSSMQARACTYW